MFLYTATYYNFWAGDSHFGAWKEYWEKEKGWNIHNYGSTDFPAICCAGNAMIYTNPNPKDSEKKVLENAVWTEMPETVSHLMLQHCKKAVEPSEVDNEDRSILLLIDSPSWGHSPKIDRRYLQKENCINSQTYVGGGVIFAIFHIENENSLNLGIAHFYNQNGDLC